MRPLLSAVVVLASLSGPAMAQDAPEPKVNQLIVYGEDPCPVSTDDVITVCARKDEGERYRIPQALRQSESRQNEAWNNRVLAYETVGRSGTMSCSPTGAGGWTGCSGKLIAEAYAEKKASPDVRFGELIAKEREKRLSTIDAEAGETQARVEELEKQVEELQRAEQAGESADKTADNPPPQPPR